MDRAALTDRLIIKSAFYTLIETSLGGPLCAILWPSISQTLESTLSCPKTERSGENCTDFDLLVHDMSLQLPTTVLTLPSKVSG